MLGNLDLHIERIGTMLGFSLATSIPTALVRESSNFLTQFAARERAMSSSSLFIWAILTLQPNNLDQVTVGLFWQNLVNVYL